MDANRMLRWLDSQLPLEEERTDADLAGLVASTRKEDRHNLKVTNASAYNKLKHYAEEGMESKFGLLKNIDNDNDTEAMKTVYNVAVLIAQLGAALARYDMAHIFEKVANKFDWDDGGQYHYPSPSSTSYELLTNCKNLTLENVKHMSTFLSRRGQEFHVESLIWSGNKTLNSCEEEL